jgi:hypothetical protein
VAVGYGPKMFQSVLRFQRLLNFAHNMGARGALHSSPRTRTMPIKRT